MSEKEDQVEWESQVFANQLRERIAAVEERDWELWILVVVVLGVLTGGFLCVIWPAVFMGQNRIYLQVNMSSQLALGLLSLIFLFTIYLVNRQLQIRKQRFSSIMEAWHFGVAQTQFFMDPLTKVFNRSALADILSKEIKLVQRRKSPMSFLYIDVNNFRNVNTRYGHISGDLVLTEVGALLKQCARGSDYIVRVGGDEFLVVLMDTDTAGAEVVKSRITRRVQHWNDNSNLHDFELCLSIGVQLYDHTKSFETALAEADSKMYAEKASRVLV